MINRNIWIFLKQDKKKKKERNQRKNNDNRLVKDRIIREIRTLLEQEEHYYKFKRVSNFLKNNYIE